MEWQFVHYFWRTWMDQFECVAGTNPAPHFSNIHKMCENKNFHSQCVFVYMHCIWILGLCLWLLSFIICFEPGLKLECQFTLFTWSTNFIITKMLEDCLVFSCFSWVIEKCWCTPGQVITLINAHFCKIIGEFESILMQIILFLSSYEFKSFNPFYIWKISQIFLR